MEGVDVGNADGYLLGNVDWIVLGLDEMIFC